MNHPTRDEWMSYLYDELPSEQHATLGAHLEVCPECKAKITEWRGVTQELSAWKVEVKPARVGFHRPLVRWAAAAALVIGIGFTAGRLSGPVNTDKLRAAIEPSIRQQLRQEFSRLLQDELEKSSSATLAAANNQSKELIGDLTRGYEQNRADDNQAVYAALNKLNSQRIADLADLKKELDTVALYSEAGFHETQRRFVQLASYTQPAANLTDSPQE